LNRDKKYPLEDRLASISLDASPLNPGQLMYECGYSAGLAAGRGRSVPLFWQSAAVVAVLLLGGLAGRWTAPRQPTFLPNTIAVTNLTESGDATEENFQSDLQRIRQSSQPSVVDDSRVWYAAMSPDQLHRLDPFRSVPNADVIEIAPSTPLMIGGGYRLLQ
jgi:hypothetical protein